ncbi:MAG: hypothetical protein O3A46_08330 [Candidatus Poribacteria bacterium]|nr:hypothetical protein [Candidatus Poribacteria bacterium]
MSDIRRVTFDPHPLIIGKPVTVTLEVDDPSAVASVKAYDPRGYELSMKRNGDTFILTEIVPYDADPGVYSTTFVVTDLNGDVARKVVEFNID